MTQIILILLSKNFIKMQIFEFPNFVSPLTCDRIKRWLELQSKQKKNEESFFDGRTIPFTQIQDSMTKRLVNKFRFDATMQAVVTYGDKVYPDYTDLVYWPTGMKMDVHSDAYFPDGKPGKFPWRKYSGVLYLNDDYQGGLTYFPNQKVSINPEKGKLVLFPSDFEHPHGVSMVADGERYTMPIWFTEDITKIEV